MKKLTTMRNIILRYRNIVFLAMRLLFCETSVISKYTYTFHGLIYAKRLKAFHVNN